MRTALRYVRAFVQALRLTLRGQKPPTLQAEERHAPLLQWCRDTLTRVDEVQAAVQQNGVDAKTTTLHIEGRDVTLDHALSVIRFHVTREYPHLIRSGDTFAVPAIHATNYNDRFLVLRLGEYEGLPETVRTNLSALNEHMLNIPKV